MPIIVLAQKESDKISAGNQVDLDIEFIAASVGVKFQFTEKWQMGPTIGLGMAFVGGVFDESSSNFSGFYGFEFIRLGLTFKYFSSERLSFEIEPKVSAMMWMSNRSGYINGGVGLLGLSGYYGKKVQVGLKLTLGLSNMGSGSENLFISSSFIVLRIPLKKW